MASTKKAQAQVEAPAPAPELCDPCHYPMGTGVDRVECGWVGRSLSMHVKVHKNSRTKKAVTIAEYKRMFPKANIGKPAYVPSPEAVKKFRDANPKLLVNQHKRIEANKVSDKAQRAKDKALEDRTEELWAIVYHDVAAKFMCQQVAEDEAIIQDLRRRYAQVATIKEQRSDISKGEIAKEITLVTSRLQESMKNLDITASQRRKANNLGSDTVAQIISNYAGTKRKFSPERQRLLEERVAVVRAEVHERVRQRILSDVADDPSLTEISSEIKLDPLDKELLAYSAKAI